MPSRVTMLKTAQEAAERAAKDMGWDTALIADLGGDVEILLHKDPDIEQMATARLSAVVRVVQDIGPAADYSAVEEYDYASHEDPVAPDPFTVDAAVEIAEAADHTDEPAVIDLPEPELPDPFDELVDEMAASGLYEVIEAPVPAVELAQEPLEVKPVRKAKKASVPQLRAQVKALGGTGYSRLNKAGLTALLANLKRLAQGPIEDVSGDGPEPATIKEIASSGDLQDRGGFPYPKQVVSLGAATLAKLDVIEFAGRTIIARQGNDVRVLGCRIKASTKAQWEREGWTFTHVSKEDGRTLLRALTDAKRAAQNIGPVSIKHRKGEALVERHSNGRTYTIPGYEFLVTKGNMVNRFVSIDETVWRPKWNIAIVRA